MKLVLVVLIALACLLGCDMSTSDNSCATYSSEMQLAYVFGGSWEQGAVYTKPYEAQYWIDTLQFIPRSRDTLAFIEGRCPGFSIRNRSVNDTITTWVVDSLVSHPEWGLCNASGTISLPTNSKKISLILTPTVVRLSYSWEECSSGDDDDDDDDDEWDD